MTPSEIRGEGEGKLELFQSPDENNGGAVISDDGLYRYLLWRTWDYAAPSILWVMLNPSTADALTDDPTIRRCMGFAKREGCGGIKVVNLYALRATKPTHLLDVPDPGGPDNAFAWGQAIATCDGPVVAAWGASQPKGCPSSSALLNYVNYLREWKCLGHTASGKPRHPLYVKADQPLIELTGATARV